MNAMIPADEFPSDIHYHKVKGERFLIYCDIPIEEFRVSHYSSVSFRLIGSQTDKCCIRIVLDSKGKTRHFTLTLLHGKTEKAIEMVRSDDQQLEYHVPISGKVIIKWK